VPTSSPPHFSARGRFFRARLALRLLPGFGSPGGGSIPGNCANAGQGATTRRPTAYSAYGPLVDARGDGAFLQPTQHRALWFFRLDRALRSSTAAGSVYSYTARLGRGRREHGAELRLLAGGVSCVSWSGRGHYLRLTVRRSWHVYVPRP